MRAGIGKADLARVEIEAADGGEFLGDARRHRPACHSSEKRQAQHDQPSAPDRGDTRAEVEKWCRRRGCCVRRRVDDRLFWKRRRRCRTLILAGFRSIFRRHERGRSGFGRRPDEIIRADDGTAHVDLCVAPDRQLSFAATKLLDFIERFMSERTNRRTETKD